MWRNNNKIYEFSKYDRNFSLFSSIFNERTCLLKNSFSIHTFSIWNCNYIYICYYGFLCDFGSCVMLVNKTMPFGLILCSILLVLLGTFKWMASNAYGYIFNNQKLLLSNILFYFIYNYTIKNIKLFTIYNWIIKVRTYQKT